jgi:hypothetical protein
MNPIANNSTLPVAYQLRDIRGLDPLSWWPPAPGWWLVLAGIIICLWLIWHLSPTMRRLTIFSFSWHWDAIRQLRALRKRVRKQEVWRSARELSELLRRIAITKYGRDVCAGLTGMAWLEWLDTHDPAYAWTEQGKILLTLPYAPPELLAADKRKLLELIDAALVWLKRSKPRTEQEIPTNV